MAVQATMDQAARSGSIMRFARGGDRDYMMRSEKRPGYTPGQPPRRRNRRRKPKADPPYVILTFLLLILVYPVGLVLLWLRRIRWAASTKLVITLGMAVVFVLLGSFALTVPIENPAISQAQAGARQSLSNLAADVEDYWSGLDLSGERIAKNYRQIAGYSIALGQRALTDGVSNVRENLISFYENLGPMLNSGADFLSRSAREALYKTNLLPTPTPEPTPTPTPLPTPTPSPTPVPMPELMYYLEGESIYHTVSNCGGRQGAVAIDEARARELDLRPCEVCAAVPTPEPVFDEDGNLVIYEEDEPVGEAYAQGEQAAASTALPASIGRGLSSETASALPSYSPDPALITPSPTPSPTPLPTPTPIVLPSAKPIGEATVYHTSNGRFYHMAEVCRNMTGAKPYTLAESIADGLGKCNTCGSPDPELLEAELAVWVGEDHVFHITDECEGLTEKWSAKTFEQALFEDGDTGCALCGANLYVQVARMYPATTPVPAAPAETQDAQTAGAEDGAEETVDPSYDQSYTPEEGETYDPNALS